LTSKTAAEKDIAKAQEEITKQISAMKTVLYGDETNGPNPDAVTHLATEIYSCDMLPSLVAHLVVLEFEARKEVAQIFNNLLRRQVGNKFPTIDYIKSQPQILDSLVDGYETPDIALNCGSMLRECLRYVDLAEILLTFATLTKFFTFVEMSNFDGSSDAFASFKDLLTKHKSVCATFLETNFDSVFASYTKLLHSQNYVVRRQSLKLLGELLLDRANFNVMTRYISDKENLKLMMNLLRDKHKTIQFEAFHVFKVFVANPNKTKEITHILVINRDKLLQFLSEFQNDKEDEQFAEEKTLLIGEIQGLQELP
jgi:calcium binding protein 39